MRTRERNVHITMPQIKRALAMRERGMSYVAIQAAMEVYEGQAPSAGTIRNYLRAAGVPSDPRGPAHANFKNCR